nr:MAG TPA: hypothetical protein [Caudoviricetes sp.]
MWKQPPPETRRPPATPKPRCGRRRGGSPTPSSANATTPSTGRRTPSGSCATPATSTR